MGTVITLPRELISRTDARRVIAGLHPGDDVAVRAGDTVRLTTAAADETVKALLSAGVQRVAVVGATPSLERMLRLVHRTRARPEASFLLTFPAVSADALLRPV